MDAPPVVTAANSANVPAARPSPGWLPDPVSDLETSHRRQTSTTVREIASEDEVQGRRPVGNQQGRTAAGTFANLRGGHGGCIIPEGVSEDIVALSLVASPPSLGGAQCEPEDGRCVRQRGFRRSLLRGAMARSSARGYHTAARTRRSLRAGTWARPGYQLTRHRMWLLPSRLCPMPQRLVETQREPVLTSGFAIGDARPNVLMAGRECASAFPVWPFYVKLLAARFAMFNANSANNAPRPTLSRGIRRQTARSH